MINRRSVCLFVSNHIWGWGSAIIGCVAILVLSAATSATAQDTCPVANTPYYTDYYGNVTVDGTAAPIGARVEAFNSAGVRTGCFEVSYPGLYGYMRVYGADAATGTPGMGNNEAVTFKVNAALAQTTPSPVSWTGDSGIHQVHLTALSLPAAVDDLAAAKTTSGVRLTWTHVGGSLNRYEVWRGETPYFTPGLSGSIKIAPNIAPPAHTGDPLEFTDTASHVGNTAIEDYYVVLAVGTNGQTSLVSNRVGACDFSLQPGS